MIDEAIRCRWMKWRGLYFERSSCAFVSPEHRKGTE